MALGRTALALLLVAGTAEGAGAQSPITDGLNVGAHVSWDALSTGSSPDWRLGAGARMGWGLNRAVQLFARLHRSTWDKGRYLAGGEWRMWSWDLGTRIHAIGVADRWTPYLELAGTRRSGHIEAQTGPAVTWPTADISGYALTLGGGVLIHVSASLAIDVGGRWSDGSVPIPSDDDPASVALGVVGVGLSWWPRSGRGGM